MTSDYIGWARAECDLLHKGSANEPEVHTNLRRLIQNRSSHGRSSTSQAHALRG